MWGFIKKPFVTAMMFFGCNEWSVTPLKCVSMNSQECKVIPEIKNINSNETRLKQVTVVVVAIILMIHMENYVFLMLLKI